ncbi:MAG: MFS transporter [Candidatus Accumulibacter sp.]|jgi:EmrB/QacA subfamily drug resistance transporter|nr:MFS transporter [Accumulibacter sp.]
MKEHDSRAIALTVAAAFFMEMLDASIITTALPAIGAAFGGTALGASASVTVYLVAMAVFVPAAGWCGERYGARRVFALAVGAFTLASLLCGLAPSLWLLIAARVLQGAAAAFMSPVGRFVVLQETPQHRIIEGIATITWPGLIAPVLGPPLGGFIVSHFSWRWIFLINVPLGLAGIWLVLRHIPRRPPTRRAGFDAPGFFLTAAALAALVEGLSGLGGNRGELAWPLFLILAGLAAGVAAVRHARRAQDPMLDLRAFRVPTYALAIGSFGFVSRVAINASPFLLPLMFQIGFAMPPTRAGLMVLVYMVGNLLMKSATTPVLRRFGFRRVLTVNGALCTATLAACGLLAPGLPMPLVYAALLLAGMSRSMNFTAVNTLAFADVDAERRAGASALATMLQQVAMTLGVAFAAFALGASQTLRAAPALELADFRNVWFAVALLMGLATAGALRLDPAAGASVSGKAQ